MEQKKKQRATWRRVDEKALLKCYVAAHSDASLKSVRCQVKGLGVIVTRLANEGIPADKDQCKTKYSRLMYEYDVFKRLCDLSGAGWDSQIKAHTLTDENWASLASCQSRNAALYKRFRQEGFEHSALCALIAGDSRATAEDATNVTENEPHALLDSLSEGPENDDGGVQRSKEGEHADKSTGGGPPFASPTTDQCADRVKRYRDGRKKNPRRLDTSSESMTSLFATAKRYFQLKADLLARQLANQEGSQEV